MQLSQLELKTLEQLAQGNNNIKEISKKLKRDQSRIYRTKQTLQQKDILHFSHGTLEPKKHTYLVLLFQLLTKYPNLIPLLADSGIPLLTTLLTYHTIKEIQQHTPYEKSIIYRKIHQALNLSIIQQPQNKTYLFNKKIWNDLISFLEEIKKYDETTDPRIPANSTIYHKTNNEILFANKGDLDATKTGFSAYLQYGIKLRLTTHYYYLPKKKLSKQEIFTHALYITQKETTIQHITFISLWYIKFNNETQKIHHPILDNIKQLLKGKNIEGYPTQEEIQEKAKIYDIRI